MQPLDTNNRANLVCSLHVAINVSTVVVSDCSFRSVCIQLFAYLGRQTYTQPQEHMSRRRRQRRIQPRKTSVVEFRFAKTIFGRAAHLTEATLVHRPAYIISYTIVLMYEWLRVHPNMIYDHLLRNSTTDVSRMQLEVDAYEYSLGSYGVL